MANPIGPAATVAGDPNPPRSTGVPATATYLGWSMGGWYADVDGVTCWYDSMQVVPYSSVGNPGYSAGLARTTRHPRNTWYRCCGAPSSWAGEELGPAVYSPVP